MEGMRGGTTAALKKGEEKGVAATSPAAILGVRTSKLSPARSSSTAASFSSSSSSSNVLRPVSSSNQAKGKVKSKAGGSNQ